MSEWSEVTLGDLAEFSNGANFTKESFGVGIKIIGVGDFGDRLSPDWDQIPEVDPGAVTSDRQRLEVNDLVFVRSNGNPALVGRSMLVTDGPSATHSAFTIRARPDTTRVDPRFLGYQLRHAHKSGLMTAANGTNITNLNQTILGLIPVLLPDMAVQRRIVSMLGAIDDLIENNRRRIALFERMAQAIYREWFVHFRYPGHWDDELLDSPRGPIPAGWEVTTIGESFATVLGGTPSRRNLDLWGGEIPWVNSGKTNELRVIEPSEYITEDGLARSNTKLMPSKTTLIAITGATLGQVTMLEAEMCANQSVVGVYDEHGVNGEWIYRTFVDRIGAIIQSASGGAQQHINKGVIEEVVIVRPPDRILAAFDASLRPAGDEIATLLRSVRCLGELRDLLLPRLVTGTIDVSHLDFDGLAGEQAA